MTIALPPPFEKPRERRIVLTGRDGLSGIFGTWLGEEPPHHHPALAAWRHVRTTERAFYFEEVVEPEGMGL